RRHTRFSRDWSSDVCSSDLELNPGITAADCRDRDALAAHCVKLGIHVKPGYGWGKLLLEIFEKTVEHTLVQPTFITHYPVEVSRSEERRVGKETSSQLSEMT